MKCPVCSKKNKTGVAICIHCGAKLPSENVVDNDNRNLVGSYKIALSKKLVIIVGSISLILIVFLLILLFSGKKKPTGQIILNNNQNRLQQNQQSLTQNQESTTNSENTNTNTETNENTSIPIQRSDGTIVTARVTDYRLRIRSKPSLRGRKVGHLPKGAEVVILKKSKRTKIRLGSRYYTGYWYKIKWEKPTDGGTPKIVTGWVWGKYLRFSNSN